MQDFLHYAQKMCAEIGSQTNILNSTNDYTGKK